MSSTSAIEITETEARSSSARHESHAHAQPAGAAGSVRVAGATASFEMETDGRAAPVPSEEELEGVEAGVVLLTCGVLAAIAGVTLLRRLGMDLESMATVLLAIGLWRILSAGRGPHDS